jgi:hypothetical protein
VLQEEAEEQLYDPAYARRELEEIDAARADRELSDEAADEAQQRVVDRLLRR